MDIEKSINISDNLRVWMLAGKMKQAELAEYLGMVPGMMSQRLMGVKEWRDEDVERISKLMNVSTEKLVQPSALGETLRRFEKSRKNPSYRKNFGGRLNRLAGKKGKTIRELSAELGMEYSGVCKWVMGTGLPSAFVLVKIANYFGLTAAQLAGFEPEAAEPEAAETETAAAEPEPETAEPEPETAETEPETAETEQETAETEQEEEKTGKCRTVDERREMFRDRLRELIERSGKTAEETARDTEIGLPLLQGYLEGKYFPGYLMAQKLAEYFDVSTEVLSGEAEMPEPETAEPEPEKEKTEQEPGELVGEDFARFGQRLSELIRRTGKDAGAVGYEIGIGLAEWDEYLRGCWLPSKKTAAKMAKYFGVPVAVLLGDEELPEEERGEPDDDEVPTEERIAARAAAEGNYTLAADIIIGRAEKVKLTELDVDKVINGLAREVAEYDAYHAWVAGEESVHCPGAILVAIAALRKLRPAKVGGFEPGRGKCPVCGEIVSEDCPMCPHCLQRLSWEIDCGDEVFMHADPECRFWICGRKENGFLYGFDMSFELHEEHQDDLEPTGRRCPELARGLEAAAKL